MSFNTKEIYIEAKSSNETTSTITQEVNTIATVSNEPAILKDKSKPITTTNKTIANNNTVKSNTVLAQDIVAYFIESTFSDDKLDDVVSKLKTHGITLKIKGVKRNSDNEITAIKIDAKSNNSNANFSISNDSAIKTIKITYSAKNNSISIGSTNGLIHDKDHVFTHEDGTFTIKKSGKGSNVFVYSDSEHENDEEHEHETEVIEDGNKIIIKKGNKVHELKKAHKDKDKNIFAISGDDDIEFKVINGDTITTNDGKLIIKGKNTIVNKGNGMSFVISGGKGKTYEYHADTIESDGKIYKLKGNVVFKSKGENSELFELKSEGDENGDIMFITKDKDGNIAKEKVKGNTFTFTSDDGKIFKSKSTKKGGSNIWISKDDNEAKTITKIGKNSGSMFFTSDSAKNHLIVVDGKVVKNKKLEDIDVDNVRSVNVLKGESAEKKYGKKGKDGVIEITLKKKKD